MSRSRPTIYRGTARVAILMAIMVGVAVSAASATDVKPRRVIKDHDPNFNTLWVDTVNDEILVGNDAQETLQVYSRTANGVVAPLREIKGHATFVTYPGQVVIDAEHNEIWSVGNDIADLVTVYHRTDDGNVAPVRRINGRLEQLKFERSWGLALDTGNGEVAVSHQKRNQISFFGRTTNTDTNPDATTIRMPIRGSRTKLANPHGIFIDAAVNEIYVVNAGHSVGSTAPPSITVYARTAEGNAAPLRTIQGDQTRLDNARPIFVDSERHEIVVANGGPTNALLFFDQNADSDVEPLRTIEGDKTGLSNPTGVFVDTINNEILVANWGNHTITVYPRGAEGNIRPLRVISPTRSRVAVGIGNPGAIYVDAERDEIGVLN